MNEAGSVALVAMPDDEGAVASLREFLAEAGFVLVDGPADAAVALVSPASVADPVWTERVTSQVHGRWIPVVLDLAAEPGVPQRLRPLNWIRWNAEAPAETYGQVLAALLNDPEQVAALRRLRALAETWASGRHDVELLVRDRRQLAEFRSLLADRIPAEADRLLRHFLNESGRRIKALRIQRTVLWGTAGILVAAVLAVVTVIFPGLGIGSRIRTATSVTIPEPGIRAELPEWTAVLASELLVQGTEAQRETARATLAETFSAPWKAQGFDIGPERFSLEGMTPLNGGRRMLVHLFDSQSGSRLGAVDIRDGRLLWQIVVGRGFAGRVEVARDDRTAVVLNSAGISVVDLGHRTVRRVPYLLEDVPLLRLASGDRLTVATSGNEIHVVSLRTGRVVRKSPRYREVLELQTTPDGGVRALVGTAAGRYRLLDALSGRMLASGTVPATVRPLGAVAPDRDLALLSGGDGQIWRIEPGEKARPTGVPVTERSGVVRALSGERVVVGGGDERAKVFHLGGGGPLGVVCRGARDLQDILAAHDGSRLICRGSQFHEFWAVPDGPRAGPAPAGLVAERGYAAPPVTVETRAGEAKVAIGDGGERVSTDWFDVFRGAVTVAAPSPDRTQALLGSAEGDVALISTVRPRSRILARWRSPDGSPVVAAGWGPGPVVRTRSGLLWDVPPCPRCHTDEGLLDLVRDRQEGCWRERQLPLVSDETRRRIGLRACAIDVAGG